MSWLAKLFWVLLALTVFLLAALMVNQEAIVLEFLIWRTPEWSVFWWLLMAFGAGLMLGLVGLGISATRLSLRNRRLTRELGNAQRELQSVRNLSFKK